MVGPLPRVVLFASSSAVDTDFAARLSDVFPDGRAVQLQLGILRARYRERGPRLLLPSPAASIASRSICGRPPTASKRGTDCAWTYARQIFRISTATVTAAANLVNPSARSRASIATGSIRLICCCQCCAVVQFPLGLSSDRNDAK